MTKNASFMTSTPVEPRGEAGWQRGSHLQTKVLVVGRRFFAGKKITTLARSGLTVGRALDC